MTRGRKETVDFFEYQFDSYISRLSADLMVYVLHDTVFVCVFAAHTLYAYNTLLPMNANSAAKRAVRTLSVSLCHWMSQHVVY